MQINDPCCYSTEQRVLTFVTTEPIPYRYTSNFVCIKMALILISQSRDLTHGGVFSNHCKFIILLKKSLSRLKDQVKSLVYNSLSMKSIFIDCSMAWGDISVI